MFDQSKASENSEVHRPQPNDAEGTCQQVRARRVIGGENHCTASGGLAQFFGLDVRAAMLAVGVDLMVFAGDALSLETLIPLGIAVAAVLGVIVYRIQRKWYGDDHESALIKSMIVALVTAIPIPLTPLIAIPGGIVAAIRGGPASRRV
jgi:hypothetical protein